MVNLTSGGAKTSARAWLVCLLVWTLPVVLAAAPIPSAEVYVDSGLKAYKEGNLKAAATEFGKAINLKPDSLEAHYFLGRIAFIQKDYYGAFHAFKEVLALQKDYKNTQALFRQLTPPLLELVRGELKVNPRSARAYSVLGFLLLYQRRVNEGITQLEYALRFDPSLAAVHDDLAWAYYQTRRFDTALKFSEKAFTLDPVRASITRHYQQLFYLKRLGFAADQATPDRFYAPPEAGKPRTEPAPPDIQTPPVGPPPVDSPPIRPEPATPPVGPATPPPVEDEPKPVSTPERPAATAPDLSRINIDDTAIVSAFLKDYRPKPAPSTEGPTGTLSTLVKPAGTAQPTEAPPSAAEIAGRVRALYKKGKELAAKIDFEGAQQAFELLIQVDPTYRDAIKQRELMRRYSRTKKSFDQAMEFYQSQSFAAALETLRGVDLKTLREFRDVKTLDHMMGECYFHAGKFKEAADKLSKYCEDYPKELRFRYLLAKTRAELGEPGKALDELAIIRQSEPGFLDNYPESKGLRMKLTIKAYFPFVAGLALIWALVSLAYAGYKFRQTRDARRLKRTINNATQAQKEENWEKLLEVCEQFELQTGKQVGDVRVRQSKALALVNLGRLEQAQQEVAALPDDPKRQLLRARLLLETGDRGPAAMTDYRALLIAEPNNLKLLQAMAEIIQQQGATHEEAERVLQRLLELEPLKTEYAAQLAGIYLARDSYDGEAMKVFQKLAAEDPANIRARYGLARCHFVAHHFVEAIREAKSLAEYDIDNPKVHDILVDSYRNLEMLEEGEKEYRRLLQAHPGKRVLLDAVERLREATEGPMGPVSEEEMKSAYEKGMRLFGEGHFREALAPLSAAFDGNYQRTCAGALMVRAYLKLDEPGTALRVFERMDVFDQPPDEFLLALCYEMAGLYASEGHKREAMRLYNFICRHNVNYRDAFQKLEALQTAR